MRNIYACLILGWLVLITHPQCLNAQDKSSAASVNTDASMSLLAQASLAQRNGDYELALDKLNQAEVAEPDRRGVIYNLRGSIFTMQRRYQDAAQQFEKAAELLPNAYEPLFNRYEVHFVTEQYEAALNGFDSLLQRHPKLQTSLRHLVLFKLLICEIKTKKLDAAKKRAENFTFQDDTPAYYFMRAVFALEQNDQLEGHRWIKKALQLFPQTDAHLGYIDTMSEAGYLPKAEQDGNHS